MKHIFWIICGAVLVALIAAWIILVPTDVARSSKTKLDQQSKDLKELERRAEKGDPIGVFDAENPADTQRLASEYLITEQWKRVLQPHVEKYEKQLADIRAQLLGRGKWLSKTITPTKNVLEWYSAYITASEALIDRLRQAECMKGPAATEERNANGESPAAVRLAVGLYTKSGSFPEPREHALLTARLRAMELIADRLIAARVAVADSPVVGPTGRSDDRAKSSPVIFAVEWVGGDADTGMHGLTTAVSGQINARAIGLRLTLDGSLSALLSASAGLERNAQPDMPLVALTSASLTRRETALAGERFDVADDSVRMILNLEMIEFTEQATEAAPGGAQPGMPGMPGGMPPGMNMPPGGGRPPGMPPGAPAFMGSN